MQLHGDIVLYSKEDKDYKYIKQADYRTNLLPTTKYVPIAVVVVPSTHTSDGTCRCISLKPMNYNTPTVGGEYVNMTWGPLSDISGITNNNSYPTASSYYSTTATTSNIGTGTVGGGYLYGSFTKYMRYNTEFNDGTNPSIWYNNIASTKAPLPYKGDGKTKNSAYFTRLYVRYEW